MIRMKKSRLIAIIVFTVCATLAVVFLSLYMFARVNNTILVPKSTYEQNEKIADRYEKLYKMQDLIERKGLTEVSEADQMDAVYQALAKSLDDPYTKYFTKEENKKFQNAVNQTYYGIGVELAKSRGSLIAKDVLSGSPAELAGMKAGDKILRINGKSYTSIQKAKSVISGTKEGQNLKIRWTGLRKGKTVTRTSVMQLADVKDLTVNGRMLDHKIGYLQLTSVGENSADEFAAEMKDLEAKGAKGLVIDLRGNGGGYTDQAIKIADQLLPEATITFTKTKKGEKRYYNSDEDCTKLPYVILTDGDTASAAEIITAAVKDNHGGRIIGSRTFGKGVIQSAYTFRDGSSFHLTTEEYFSPRGSRINKKGIDPDIRVSSGHSKTGADPALTRGVKTLRKAS